MNLCTLLDALARADEYEAMFARRRAAERARRARKSAERRAAGARADRAREPGADAAPPDDEAYGFALATEGGAL